MWERNKWAEFTLRVTYEEDGVEKIDKVRVCCDHLAAPADTDTLHSLVEEHRDELREWAKRNYHEDFGIRLKGWEAIVACVT